MNAPLAWPVSPLCAVKTEIDRRVHLWGWPLQPLPVDLSADIEVLSETERQRMQAFHFDQDRRQYAHTHANLHKILAAYLACHPTEIRFTANRFGKPEITGDSTSLSFSLSHSKSFAVMALTRSGPVGVDVEDVRPIEPEVAAAHFSPAELKALNQLTGAAWRDAFYRCWTRKEAILKAEGIGLHRALDTFDVALLPDEPAALLATREPFQYSWTLHDVPPAPETAGALATAHGNLTLEYFYFVD